MKKITTLLAGAALVASLALAPNAGAVAFGGANYIGQIVNGAPASGAHGYINILITLSAGATATQIPAGGETYNRVGSTAAGPFPTAVVTGGSGELAPAASYNASGHQYIWAKYGGHAYVWYSASGFSSSEVIPGAPPNSTDLSHVRLFNVARVPDAGTTLVLLGGSLIGLGALRRRFSK